MIPVRAEMVTHPGEYRWSSYQANAQGKRSDLISHHSLYQSLGGTETARQAAYRELFRYELDSEEIDKISKPSNGNFALGNKQFEEEISEMLGRRVSRGKSARPRKNNLQ